MQCRFCNTNLGKRQSGDAHQSCQQLRSALADVANPYRDEPLPSGKWVFDETHNGVRHAIYSIGHYQYGVIGDEPASPEKVKQAVRRATGTVTI